MEMYIPMQQMRYMFVGCYLNAREKEKPFKRDASHLNVFSLCELSRPYHFPFKQNWAVASMIQMMKIAIWTCMHACMHAWTLDL